MSARRSKDIRTDVLLACALTAGLATGACSGGTKPDSGPSGMDAIAPAADAVTGQDAPPIPDSGPPAPEDGGPPPEAGVLWDHVSCEPCTQCAPALCLNNPQTHEAFCSDRCDQNINACITGFTCQNLSAMNAPPAFFCLPPGGTCQIPGTGEGTGCYQDTSTCLYDINVCENDVGALGYCTNPCNQDQDCPPAYSCGVGTSGVKVCKARYLSDAELCARDELTTETACATDDDCAMLPDALCVRDEPTLPGVCGTRCGAGQSCDAPNACLSTTRGDLCLTPHCACHGTNVPIGTRDLLQDALAAVGLTRCGLTFNVFAWSLVTQDVLLDPYRLSFFDHVHNQPLGSPDWALSLVKSIDTNAKNGQMHPASRAARLVETLATLVDHPSVTEMPNLPDPSSPLAAAIEHLIIATGGTPNTATIAADAAHVPMDLQLALAGVIDAIERADHGRKSALAMVTPSAQQALYDYGPAFIAERYDGFGLDPTVAATKQVFNQLLDYGKLYGGSVGILDAIAAAELERFRVVPTATVATSSATLIFSQDTPIGRIAIGDGNPGIYDSRSPRFAGPWALLIDLGGNDVYRTPVGGNVSFQNSVSVMIDLGGDDQYGYVAVPDPQDGARLPSDGHGRYHPTMSPTKDNGPISFSEVPRQGGGRMGVGVLVDLGGGNNRYVSLRMSQGAGMFGAGVLVDDGGDDTYLAESVAQGSGEFGIGLLYDVAGNDVHRAYSMAQGFAFARGSGLLYDVAGDDKYLMDVGDPSLGGDPLYFSAQRPGLSNATLGQGFGFGRRADTTDRAFMSGGVGILIDAVGTDEYQGSIFTQGGGFWFGTGILADEAGNDHYDGLWYSTGAAAHFSLGFALEGGGDDVYGGTFPAVDVTLGSSEDYSAAFLIDESGNDSYFGRRLTMGCSQANAMGFFADNGGDDQYHATSINSLGTSELGGSDVDFPGSPRHRVNTIAVFMDAAGHNTYMRPDMRWASMTGTIADGNLWTQSANADPIVNKVEKGVGVEGVGETVLHARF